MLRFARPAFVAFALRARPSQAFPTESSGAAQAAGNPMRQLLLDFTQAPAPTFANFVHGGNAELAHALEAAVKGELAERVLYVWGESGAGKTHLLKAFAEGSSALRARYLRAEDFGAENFAPGHAAAMLAIDDIERLPEPEQVALFNA